jgi:nitric oxide reductase NorQ protein
VKVTLEEKLAAKGAGEVGMGDNKLSYTVEKTDRGIFYPGEDKNFFVRPEHDKLLSVINEMSMAAPQNVMMVGPQGCGKTELIVWFAAKYKRPIIIMNCATIREAKDWFGYRDAKDGTLSWHQSDFVRALSKGDCVVLLDEFNRLHTTLHNTLYPLLDARRATFVEEIDEIVKVGPNTVFFATANIGFQHTGTFTMDSAMEDRWGIRVDVGFPPEDKEIEIVVSKTGIEIPLAKKLCQLAQNVRRKSQGAGASLTKAISTRQLLQSAKVMRQMVNKGMEAGKALDYTIVPFYSKEGGRESEQAQILQLVQGIFG